MVGGSKEKQTNAEKGGEGVQNPGNFADVLYVWSLRKQRLAKIGQNRSKSRTLK